MEDLGELAHQHQQKLREGYNWRLGIPKTYKKKYNKLNYA